MSYPQDALHPSEDLILDLHPHWWYFAKSAGVGFIAVVVALIVLLQDWDWAKIPAALFLLFTLGWVLQRYISWVSTHFVLTSDRVIYRSGIIAKRGIEIPLERINTIFFNQRIFERMFGLGDLEIESASKDGAQRFEDIKNPSAVQNEIYQQMEQNEVKQANRISGAINTAYAAQPAQPAPPAPSANVADQIQQLALLRDQGHITPEEFEAKKAELLGRM
ncbi:MAG TPA: PH domain-containing protein [Acidimicrobiales bacterium]